LIGPFLFPKADGGEEAGRDSQVIWQPARLGTLSPQTVDELELLLLFSC
jgi:hypothetical protein